MTLEDADNYLHKIIKSDLCQTNDQICDAIIVSKEKIDVHPIVIAIVQQWKKDLSDELKRAYAPTKEIVVKKGKSRSVKLIQGRGPDTHIFWHSDIYNTTLDAISRYRFLDIFNINDFIDAQNEIEAMFESIFLDSHHKILIHSQVFGNEEFLGKLFDLWLATRSDRLCSRIRKSIDNILILISYIQEKEGYWLKLFDYNNGKIKKPDSECTALCCYSILRLSRDINQIKQAYKGISWLVKQQQPNGAWSITKFKYNFDKGFVEVIEQADDIFTTVLVIQTIKLSGLDGYDTSVEMAEKWLLSQQKEDGSFETNELPYPLFTVLVVECFENLLIPRFGTNNHLSIAQNFILRSIELAEENDENSKRLAVITAYTGLESFLYSLLSDSSINEKIFDGEYTIGFRKALFKLEKHLREKKLIAPTQSINYKNELDRLAYSRDQIIHKAANISEIDAKELVKASKEFSNEMYYYLFKKYLYY